MSGPTADQPVHTPTFLASWDDLTFLHWPVPPSKVQRLLPRGLTVDEYDGAAWIGLTPFVMSHMRPLGLPVPGPVPGLPDPATSPETNLRTYVHGPDGHDGVWFLSMDIGNPVVAVVLRGLIGAPYHVGSLRVDAREGYVEYSGRRAGGGPGYRLRVRPGDRVEQSELETWLTGRWRLYTRHVGRLLATPIEHEPWTLHNAECDVLEQDVTDAFLLPVTDPPLVHFAEKVADVRAGIPRVVG